MNKKVEDFLPISEAANELGWNYHRLLSWIKKDKEGLQTKGLAIKVGWNWLLHKSAIPLIQKAEK